MIAGRPVVVACVAAGLAWLAPMAEVSAGPIATIRRPIVGGEIAADGEFPTVVAVINDDVGGLCTGTLIHPEWVLTAAHCIDPVVIGAGSQDEVTAATLVSLDSNDLDAGGGWQIRADRTIPNPGFDRTDLGDDDIGLIHLSQPVTDRQVTAVNRRAADARPGVEVVMVGFGATSGTAPGPGETNDGVEYVLRDRPSVACRTVPLSGVTLDDANLLCFSQRDDKGKCNGDSGGPSFATIRGALTVVGVTSFGDQACVYMNADTRVDAETAFLDQHIADLACVDDGVCGDACGSGELPVDVDCGDDDGGCGCASSGRPGAGAALLAMAAVALRRRRRPAPASRTDDQR